MDFLKKTAITLEEAQALAARVNLIPAEEIRAADALGRVLRQDLVADVDCPTADVSAMDGYAFAARSTEGAMVGAPAVLRQVGGVRAGGAAPPGPPRAPVGPGECVAVTTGAVLPAGTDAVARREDVQPARGGIALTHPVPRWAHVRRRGEIFARGAAIVLEGQRVTPAVAGLLASLDAALILVSRKPKVAILPTGDELVDPARVPAAGQVRSSNAVMLAALAAQSGCDATIEAPAPDDLEQLARRLEACRKFDAVLVTGGVSGGDFDLVPKALEALGAEIVFHGIRVTPGKCTTWARLGNTFYACFPGSPGAALAGFVMLARPALARMMGACNTGLVVITATSTQRIEKEVGLARLVPARLCPRAIESGARSSAAAGLAGPPAAVPAAAPAAPPSTRPGAHAFLVEPAGSRGSGDVIAVAAADCLIWLREEQGAVEAGSQVDVVLI